MLSRETQDDLYGCLMTLVMFFGGFVLLVCLAMAVAGGGSPY